MALLGKHIIQAGGAIPAFVIGLKNGVIVKDEPTTVENVYWKVFHINADKNKIHATVNGYINNQEYQLASKYVQIDASLEGDNFIKQVYMHLKTLPEFANAQDC